MQQLAFEIVRQCTYMSPSSISKRFISSDLNGSMVVAQVGVYHVVKGLVSSNATTKNKEPLCEACKTRKIDQ